MKAVKPLVDFGLSAVLIVIIAAFVYRPPRWVHSAIAAHSRLADGVTAIVNTMPKREDTQEILIGQEALRRETSELRHELIEIRHDLRRVIDERG